MAENVDNTLTLEIPKEIRKEVREMRFCKRWTILAVLNAVSPSSGTIWS